MAKFLTQEQVDKLEDGTLIGVMWAGGVDEPVTRTAQKIGNTVYATLPGTLTKSEYALSNVGKTRWHTRVFRLEA